MKWFKHSTDAHTNLKLQSVIDAHGLSAFGYYWMCVELVGLQGDENFVVKGEKNWKIYLKKQGNLDVETQEIYLKLFSALNLIDATELEKGHLHIPKMAERSDDYTSRVRRVYEQSLDNVHLEENRIDKKRKEKNIYTSSFEEFWKLYPKKVGKTKAFGEWKKITDKEHKLILLDIPKRIADEKWVKGFVKDPERYLKHRQWDDEIIAPKQEDGVKILRFKK